MSNILYQVIEESSYRDFNEVYCTTLDFTLAYLILERCKETRSEYSKFKILEQSLDTSPPDLLWLFYNEDTEVVPCRNDDFHYNECEEVVAKTLDEAKKKRKKS